MSRSLIEFSRQLDKIWQRSRSSGSSTPCRCRMMLMGNWIFRNFFESSRFTRAAQIWRHLHMVGEYSWKIVRKLFSLKTKMNKLSYIYLKKTKRVLKWWIQSMIFIILPHIQIHKTEFWLPNSMYWMESSSLRIPLLFGPKSASYKARDGIVRLRRGTTTTNKMGIGRCLKNNCVPSK